MVSEGFLVRIVPAPPFSPFYCFYRVWLLYSVTKPSSFRSCNLSLVLHNTCIVFVKRPSELGLNVTMISLVCPGRTGRFSHCGLVQPQVVSTSFMRRGCVPVFFHNWWCLLKNIESNSVVIVFVLNRILLILLLMILSITIFSLSFNDWNIFLVSTL